MCEIAYFVEKLHQHFRPAGVPDDWDIYVSLRPLLGHKVWTGPFNHGIHYAAIAPDGATDHLLPGARMREENRRNQARLCIWIPWEEVMTDVARRARKYGVSEEEIMVGYSEKALAMDYRNFIEGEGRRAIPETPSPRE